MANEINSVGGVQNQIDTRKQTEIQKQEQSKINIEFPKGQEQAKPADFNAYGKDIANFEKFKGNDKNDAMRMTNSAANDVKKAYMQLQHEFPGISLEFEAMPDPTKCGKKREGFFNYQQQLDDWKDLAMTQIYNAREQSTKEMGDDIMTNSNKNADKVITNNDKNIDKVMTNDDKNTAELKGAIDENADKVMANDYKNTAELKGAIDKNADKVIANKKNRARKPAFQKDLPKLTPLPNGRPTSGKDPAIADHFSPIETKPEPTPKAVVEKIIKKGVETFPPVIAGEKAAEILKKFIE